MISVGCRLPLLIPLTEFPEKDRNSANPFYVSPELPGMRASPSVVQHSYLIADSKEVRQAKISADKFEEAYAIDQT